MVKSPLDDPVTKKFPLGENAQATKEPPLTFPDLKSKSTQDLNLEQVNFYRSDVSNAV